MAYSAGGRTYYDVGETLKHRSMGYVGKYISEVFVNKGKRHLLVQALDSAQRWVLPDQDWEPLEAAKALPG